MLSTIEMILFVAAIGIAAAVALRAFAHKMKLISFGRDVDRYDNSGSRIGTMLKRVLLQQCAYGRRPVSGFFHSMIFWGFLVFVLVTINHVLEGFIAGFSLFGHGIIYKGIIFVANIFAVMIIIAVVYFLVRRYIFKPSTLEIPSWESLIILTFISILMVTFAYYEAYRMYAFPGSNANFLSKFVFENLLPVREATTVGAIAFWIKFNWWVHILTVMAFGAFIPHSKHLHLIAGPINILFKNNRVLAEIPVVDLEKAAEEEKLGMPDIREFTKKDMLDLFSCAECGRCDDMCPALNSGKDLSPKTLLNKFKDNLYDSEKLLEAAKKAKAEGKEAGELEFKTLFSQVITENEVWDCTTCGGCMEVCPMFNEHIPKIMGMRQYAVMMESNFPEEFNALFRGLENQGNPWGIGPQSRADWAEDLDVPLMSSKENTDVLLWVGCEGSYDAHNQKNTQAFVKVLKAAGVDFAFLGNDEKCCGDPARRSGHEYLYQMLAMENIELLKSFEGKFKRIVTMCPHGMHVLKHEYKQMDEDLNLEVVHYANFLQELIAEGKLKLKGGMNIKATYHDPCYLGRYNDEYNAPRDVLKATGANVTEMKCTKKSSFCCGAGGGGMWKEESKGDRVNHVRLKQAQEAGADTIVTSCPYCSVMFKDGIDEMEAENLKTRDLAQLVLENLDK